MCLVLVLVYGAQSIRRPCALNFAVGGSILQTVAESVETESKSVGSKPKSVGT